MKRRTRRVNYLSNNLLLKEIHKSKNTFCSFMDERYEDFDIIVDSVSELTDTKIREAKTIRAKRLNEATGDKMFAEGMANKDVENYLKEHGIDPKDIQLEDIVVRVMDNSHIPRELNKKGNEVPVPTKFPPFQHYAYINGQWMCVGKSNWAGGVHNGYFTEEEGELTIQLQRSIMLLAERYAGKYNWRGYTWNEDMMGEAIMKLYAEALKFNEARSNNPFAFYTTIAKNCFTKVHNAEKLQLNIKSGLTNYSGDWQENFNEMAQRDIDNFYENEGIEKPDFVMNKKLANIKKSKQSK